MARYRATVETPRPAREVFDYLADFSNAEEWDPGVEEGRPLTPGRPAAGSEYQLTARVLGRSVPLRYRITAIDDGRRVVLEADATGFRSVDEIVVEATGSGSRVTYDADLRPKGVVRVADPLVGLAFRRIGDRAAEGLRRALA